ncbi:MAG: YciI family protein [Candidatus Dormibacteraceae bacterium]
MQQYLLSVFEPPGEAPAPEVLGPIMERVAAWRGELEEQRAWVFTARLHHPLTATVVRRRAEETLITDGPFVESKEQLGGFTIIRAEDLDEALYWAGKFTAATGLAVEVRPLLDKA